MTQCRECHFEINNEDAFCPFCGVAIGRPASENNAVDTVSAGENAASEAEAVDLIDTTERHSTDADDAGNPLVEQDGVPPVPVVFEQTELPDDAENQNEYTLNEYDETNVKEGADVEEINRQNFDVSDDEEVSQSTNAETAANFETNSIAADDDAGNRADAPKADKITDTESENSPDDNQASAEDSNIENADSQIDDTSPNPSASAPVEIGAETVNEDDSDVAKNDSPDEQKVDGPQAPHRTEALNTDGRKSAKLKPLDAGACLNNRYEIVRKIGGGGMGAVYLATDKNLGGTLRAVKEMVQSYIEDAQQEKAIADFKRESVLLTQLEHHSIPTIYDYFYEENEARFYLVMKYISGGDLSLRLRSSPEGRIDEKNVVEWAIQISDVLDYLHNRRPPIVYRDLKPANIMIDGNTGRAMLIDFGIARWVNKEEKGVTAVGTMGYAPPELFSGNVEPRSDIYSLGSTMFHLLTGADPQSNPLLIFDFQKNPRPRQINPQLSDQIEKILMRAVEYNADKRFVSAAELRATLEKHLERIKSNELTYGVREVPHSVTLSEQPVFCGFCGQKIVATDMFCAFCGAKQPMARQGVHSEEYVSKTATAKLLILGTNELEAPAFNIEKDDNLLGRRDPMSNIFPEVDLSKYDPQTKISRRHARIRRRGDSFLVEDLGSSNGTLVISAKQENLRLTPNKPHALADGDKLKIGDTTLHFTNH